MKHLLTLILFAAAFVLNVAAKTVFQTGWISDEAGERVELRLHTDGTFVTVAKDGTEVHYNVSVIELILDPDTQRVITLTYAPGWVYTPLGWVYATSGPVAGWQYVDDVSAWAYIQE